MNVAERTLYESVLDTFEAINQKNPVPHSTETSQTMNALNPFCTQKKKLLILFVFLLAAIRHMCSSI